MELFTPIYNSSFNHLKHNLSAQAKRGIMSYSVEEQKRIDQYVRQKRADIKWLNALNNATQLVSSLGKKPKAKVIRAWAEWFYRQAPPIALKPKPKVVRVSAKKMVVIKQQMRRIRKSAIKR